MIIKVKDSIQPSLDLLESLAASPGLDAQIATAIRRETSALRGGSKGERECAFYLDGVVKDHPNRVIIHDLRVEHDGEVAQFDHLLINRSLDVWILESKSFLNGLRISEQGDFEYWYDGRFHAIPSPIEQAKRQARILGKVFEVHDLTPKRLGFSLNPTIKTAILVDPRTRVDRPKSFDTDMVIKADAFFTRYEQMNEQAGGLDLMGSLAKRVSKETIIEIGQRLVALHRPHQVDYRAKFGIAETSVAPVAPARPPAPATPTVNSAIPAVSPACPACGSPMTLRTAKRGDNAGSSFWGCTTYPKCRGMVAADRPVPTPAPKQEAPAVVQAPMAPTASAPPTAPACPRCGKTMLLRTAKQGGNQFWGCPAFPGCRGMVSLAPNAAAQQPG
jgi:ssDNA-binding Zn-finger/Zn-ribbon topoisomerase 1